MQHQKVAVLVAGELRYWAQAAASIIKFSNTLGVSIDFYMAVWDTTVYSPMGAEYNPSNRRQVTETEIKQQFANANLIDFCLVPETHTPQNAPSHYKQAYLSKVANILKIKNELENDFVYDLVFEVRPDIFVFSETTTLPLLTNFDFSNTIGPVNENNLLGNGADTYCFSDSVTNDILASRYYYKKINVDANVSVVQHYGYGHWLASKFRYSLMLKYKQLVDFRVCILRHNSPENIRDLSYADVDKLEREFYELSKTVAEKHSPHHSLVLI
jgi:hypothetical protein